MHEDFDAFLRNTAPDHLLREDHRRQLKLVLMGKIRGQRPRVSLPMASAFIFVLILALTTSQSDLGSYDFDLVPTAPFGSNLAEYRSEMGSLHIAMNRGSLSESQEQATLEGVIEHELARQEELQGITGWTIDGTTFFMVHYVYEIDGQETAMTRFSDTPSELPSRDQTAFMLNNQAEVLKLIQADGAHFLGTEDRLIDGMPVRFRKWTARLPDQPEVICWLGTLVE